MLNEARLLDKETLLVLDRLLQLNYNRMSVECIQVKLYLFLSELLN